MSRVGGRNTTPELLVRRMLHALGYRFRLHAKELPGRPDIVLRPRKLAIFVHGCFWHAHRCPKGRLPKSNADYWTEKRLANKARDWRNVRQLRALGWRILVIWQCELKDELAVRRRIVDFLR